jgi:hypothetical protein
MILGFKTQFANGEPTNFEQKILEGSKIHTLREGDRWSKGNFIHMATGVRTKEYKQFNTCREDLQKCVDTQPVHITWVEGKIDVFVNGRYLTRQEVRQFIKNDGLREHEFLDWFFPYAEDMWQGQIIHWTDFKY